MPVGSSSCGYAAASAAGVRVCCATDALDPVACLAAEPVRSRSSVGHCCQSVAASIPVDVMQQPDVSWEWSVRAWAMMGQLEGCCADRGSGPTPSLCRQASMAAAQCACRPRCAAWRRCGRRWGAPRTRTARPTRSASWPSGRSRAASRTRCWCTRPSATPARPATQPGRRACRTRREGRRHQWPVRCRWRAFREPCPAPLQDKAHLARLCAEEQRLPALQACSGCGSGPDGGSWLRLRQPRTAGVTAPAAAAGTGEQALQPAPVRVPPRLPPAGAAPLAGRRVGVFWRWFEDADAEVAAACRHALRLMEERACEVRTGGRPGAHAPQPPAIRPTP